jgi:hypothetical protein
VPVCLELPDGGSAQPQYPLSGLEGMGSYISERIVKLGKDFLVLRLHGQLS